MWKYIISYKVIKSLHSNFTNVYNVKYAITSDVRGQYPISILSYKCIHNLRLIEHFLNGITIKFSIDSNQQSIENLLYKMKVKNQAHYFREAIVNNYKLCCVSLSVQLPSFEPH